MQNLEFTDQFMNSPGDLQSFTFNDISTNSDMENFIQALSGLKSKPVTPDLVSSIITHYASRCLPELSHENTIPNSTIETVTSKVTKKKFFIETVISILPPDRDYIPCNFLLRLLRAANAVRVEPIYVSDLEKRVSWQLDQASLEELMIPCFSQSSTSTLLDVGLVSRLVRGFLDTEDVSRRGGAVAKVAKLIDCYLAEVAVDSYLALPEFFELANAIPSHARSTDDGLYRAVDTYFKAHPGLSKQDRKILCGLIDTHKLSQEASHHAALNERMPVRAVLHLLLSEQTKLNKNIIDWSGSLSGSRSQEGPIGPDYVSRCHSKREMGPQQQQIMEINKLKDDVLRLQSRCMAMEKQIEKMTSEKKRSSSSSSSGFTLSWKKLGLSPAFKAKKNGEIDGEESEGGDHEISKATAFDMKARLVRGKNRRRSLS